MMGPLKQCTSLSTESLMIGSNISLFVGVAPRHKFPYRIVRVPSVIIPFNISYRSALPGLADRKLRRILNDFNPDVVHISTPSLLGFFGLSYAKENQIPVLSIYHTHFISYMRYYFIKVPFLIKASEFLITNLYRKFYNRCNLVYVPTDFMIKELVDHGISRKLLKQWHRGLDTKLFHPGRKDEAYIRSITGNEKPCLLYASRIVWEKNIETLFDIYDEAEAQQLDVNFIVAGNGVAEPEARKRMKTLFLWDISTSKNLGNYMHLPTFSSSPPFPKRTATWSWRQQLADVFPLLHGEAVHRFWLRMV